MRGLFANSQLQIELGKKVDSITLKTIFVSSELTKRAITMNSLLENSLDTSTLKSIKELPKLDCQLKRSCQNVTDSENESDTKMFSSVLGVPRKSLESSQLSLTQESLKNNTEKIKLIIENQHETLTSNKCGKVSEEASPSGLSRLLDSIESLLNDENNSLSIELFYISFEYMRIAKFILQSFNNIRHFPAKIESKIVGKAANVGIFSLKAANAINLALDKISINPFKQQLGLNKNILSVKLEDILKTSPKKSLSYDQDLECKKCSAFYSFYCKVEKELQRNVWTEYWHCCLCGHQNSFKNRINDFNIGAADYDDIEYLIDTMEQVKQIVRIEQVDSKIIVFCIDVSGSMANDRIAVVKSSCLNTLKLLKEKNPSFKVALTIFENIGTYFGSGDLKESTISMLDWDSNGKYRVSNQAAALKPISETYDQMVNAINNLQASGGTRIMSALAHSVLLASNVNNSEVILCTDGEADDRSNNEYDKITKYCNENGNVQINIVTFSDSNCDLNSLGRLASMTNGLVSKTSDPIKFESAFKTIIDQSSKKTFVNGISILSSYDKIKFRLNGSNAHQFDLTGAKPAEMLLEFYTEDDQKMQGTQSLFFQIKVIRDNRTRIITKNVAIEKNDCKAKLRDPNIIHAFALRKLTHYIYIENNFIDAATYLKDYKEFLANCKNVDSLVTSTVKILEGLTSISSISEMDSVMIHNNQCINSYDLTSYTIELTDSMDSDSEMISKNTKEMKIIFNESCSQLREIADRRNSVINFKNKVSDKLEVLDRDFMQPYTNTKVMHIVMELMDQMSLLLKKNGKSEESDYEDNDDSDGESYYALKNFLMKEFQIMEKIFVKFDQLQPYSESWIANNEHLTQELFQNIVAKLEESRKSMSQISNNMTQTIVKSFNIIKSVFVFNSLF